MPLTGVVRCLIRRFAEEDFFGALLAEPNVVPVRWYQAGPVLWTFKSECDFAVLNSCGHGMTSACATKAEVVVLHHSFGVA